MILFFSNRFPPQWSCKIATLGRLGFLGKMPGTNGSAAGLIGYTLFFHTQPLPFYLLTCMLLIAMAISICTQAEQSFGEKDPPYVILDEAVAMPLCFIGLQPTMQFYPVWWFMLIGFALFRLFDILKPFGIRSLQKLPGGQGIVLDDVAAAIATCVCLHLWTLFLQ